MEKAPKEVTRMAGNKTSGLYLFDDGQIVYRHKVGCTVRDSVLPDRVARLAIHDPDQVLLFLMYQDMVELYEKIHIKG